MMDKKDIKEYHGGSYTATGRRDMATKKENNQYQKNYDEIFGQKEIKELEESYKEARRQTAERTKRTYKKLKDHATDMSYENESKK
tara:strand:- start:4 stop:261 length:258 start_codon:yes stop_codon:yes gene_type:complete